MTKTILSEGGKVPVVDRDGRSLTPRLAESLACWSGVQQRLHIANN